MTMLKKLLFSNYSYTDLGLLIIRLGVGLSMSIFHGWGKITGGPETWSGIGSNMAALGLDFAPVFWGFMAALAEFGGSLCLILGFFFRPAAALLVITMIVAAARHLGLPADSPGSGWGGASHALELLAIYLGLLLAGPGKYRLNQPNRS
jgi:putative oxidoreductase